MALLEPWTEIDNFTFVMCISLAFNRMLCSFFVYPVNGFAVATNRDYLLNQLVPNRAGHIILCLLVVCHFTTCLT